MERDKNNHNWTIYTKTGCNNCWIVKRLLEINKMSFETINCDEYLTERKDDFIRCMRDRMKIDDDERIYFPIVFYQGGYVKDYFELIEALTDEF